MDNISEFLDDLLPDGWEHNADTYGLEFTLICPHGYEIEQDGHCPKGCKNPLEDYI